MDRRLGADSDSDSDEVSSLLDSAREELGRGLEELRDLARGLPPAELTDHGVEAAVRSLVNRVPVAVDFAPDVSERLDATIEAAAYFVVSEGLANVVKYAAATSASVELKLANKGHPLVVTIADDGIGGAELDGGSGLRGLGDRVHAVGGLLQVSSPPGEGTRLRAELPTNVRWS